MKNKSFIGAIACTVAISISTSSRTQKKCDQSDPACVPDTEKTAKSESGPEMIIPSSESAKFVLPRVGYNSKSSKSDVVTVPNITEVTFADSTTEAKIKVEEQDAQDLDALRRRAEQGENDKNELDRRSSIIEIGG